MDEASRFVLAPNDDYYILTFYKSKNYLFQSYGVRIRNSGSRYNHFNVPFMRMYHRLCEYDYESNYHQIHMEEYLYQKKLIKKKEPQQTPKTIVNKRIFLCSLKKPKKLSFVLILSFIFTT